MSATKLRKRLLREFQAPWASLGYLPQKRLISENSHPDRKDPWVQPTAGSTPGTMYAIPSIYRIKCHPTAMVIITGIIKIS